MTINGRLLPDFHWKRSLAGESVGKTRIELFATLLRIRFEYRTAETQSLKASSSSSIDREQKIETDPCAHRGTHSQRHIVKETIHDYAMNGGNGGDDRGSVRSSGAIARHDALSAKTRVSQRAPPSDRIEIARRASHPNHGDANGSRL